MSEHKEYMIKTVEDLLQIPPEKVDACLADMKTWLDFLRKFIVIQSTIPKDMMEVGREEGFCWVDDGIEGGEVTCNIKIIP